MTLGRKSGSILGVSPRILNKDKTCSVDGCNRTVLARELCVMHYGRWQRNPDNWVVPPRILNKDKTCSVEVCEKPVYSLGSCSYHYSAAYHTRPEYRERRVTYVTTYQAKPKSQEVLATYRAKTNLATYGMTPEDYDRMLAAQDGGCAVCGGTNDNGNRLAVDHDHACCSGGGSCGRCVRGLLCQRCNSASGLLGDSIERVEMLLDYLRGHRQSAESTAA